MLWFMHAQWPTFVHVQITTNDICRQCDNNFWGPANVQWIEGGDHRQAVGLQCMWHDMISHNITWCLLSDHTQQVSPEDLLTMLTFTFVTFLFIGLCVSLVLVSTDVDPVLCVLDLHIIFWRINVIKKTFNDMGNRMHELGINCLAHRSRMLYHYTKSLH